MNGHIKMLKRCCGFHLNEFVQNCCFVSLNRSTKSRWRYRFWFQWRLKEVVRLSRNHHATQLETNWVTFLHGSFFGSLGVRWVFYVNNNLVMLVVNMVNGLLFYDMLLSQNKFFRKTIYTKKIAFLPCSVIVQRDSCSYRMAGFYLV